MPTRLHVVLLSLLLATCVARAGSPDRTPHQLIDELGLTVRQSLEDPKFQKEPEDAERAVAEEIAVIASTPSRQASLIDVDEQGRTPLMQAVSGGYVQIVKALLADAGVRATIDRPDEDGETAWMVANFAPALTLVACQPGLLTLDRYPLLRPYLRRMHALLKAERSVTVSIVQALEAAGAHPAPDAARQAWLARCPNSTPELRLAISKGPLLLSLVNDALTRQTAFNKAFREGDPNIPERPPDSMRFIPNRTKSRAPMAPSAADANRVNCTRKPPPALSGALGWSGTLLFRARIATRAGVVEAVDFSLLSQSNPEPHVVDFFRGTIVRALADYKCEGDHVFEQDFQFKVE